MKPKVLTTFTRQLATLVDAGLPLLRGLRVLEKQERNATLRGILGELALSIEGGSTFSEALAQHPKVFNRLFVNMVKAGELGGVLEVVLKRLAEFSEKAQKIKGKVKAAMFYPIAVLIVAMGIMILLLTFVIPRFQGVFEGMNIKMPKFTLFVLGVSAAVKDHFITTAIGVAACVVAFLLIIRTKIGRLVWDKFKLKVPILGPVISKVAIARFTRTLGTLVSSGVPILQALTIVKETAGNVIIANAVGGVHESRQGRRNHHRAAGRFRRLSAHGRQHGGRRRTNRRPAGNVAAHRRQLRRRSGQCRVRHDFPAGTHHDYLSGGHCRQHRHRHVFAVDRNDQPDERQRRRLAISNFQLMTKCRFGPAWQKSR